MIYGCIGAHNVFDLRGWICDGHVVRQDYQKPSTMATWIILVVCHVTGFCLGIKFGPWFWHPKTLPTLWVLLPHFAVPGYGLGIMFYRVFIHKRR